MILLDTNLISEMMKVSPSPKVIHWLNQQNTTQLYVSAVTIAEISYGLHVLPNGKRRILLEQAFDSAISEAFKQRILPFDERSAHIYGNIMGERKKFGRPMSICDGQIAAIALVHEMAIATRNIKDFQDCDIELINPFV